MDRATPGHPYSWQVTSLIDTNELFYTLEDAFIDAFPHHRRTFDALCGERVLQPTTAVYLASVRDPSNDDDLAVYSLILLARTASDALHEELAYIGDDSATTARIGRLLGADMKAGKVDGEDLVNRLCAVIVDGFVWGTAVTVEGYAQGQYLELMEQSRLIGDEMRDFRERGIAGPSLRVGLAFMDGSGSLRLLESSMHRQGLTRGVFRKNLARDVSFAAATRLVLRGWVTGLDMTHRRMEEWVPPNAKG